MSFTWDSLTDQLQTSVNERIDNEINDDEQVAPQNTSGDGLNINTTNDKTGTNKQAGTGAQIITGVSNVVVIGSGAIVLGLVAWLALK